MDVRLPIDVVPNTDPPIFKWRQTVDSLNGERVVVDHESLLPPHVEVAVARLVGVAKQVLMENASLQGQIDATEAARSETRTGGVRDGVSVPPLSHPKPVAPRRGK